MPQPYSILQLSDLHFGPNSRFLGLDPEKLGQNFAQAMKQACKEQKLPELRYCVATGDVAEAGRPKEFETAGRFFKVLLGELGIADTRCIFVPGNHDVSWSNTRQVDLQQGDEEFDDAERDRRYQQQKFKYFDEFVVKFYGQERDKLASVTKLGHGAYAYLFPDDELCFVALNTCEQESHRKQGGLLGTEQAQAAMILLRQADASGFLKIVSLHHNPLAPPTHAVSDIRADLAKRIQNLKPDDLEHYVTDLVGFEGLDRLKAIATDCRVQLVLHGHQHAASQNSWPFGTKPPGQTHILAAGSSGLHPGKLPQDEPTTVQILSIVPSKSELNLTTRVYSPRARLAGQVEPGTFSVDSASPGGKVFDLGWPLKSVSSSSKPASKKSRAGTTTPERQVEFVVALRNRLQNRYIRWEFSGLGAIQPQGRPIDATLDNMFLPLRVHSEYDLAKTKRGVVLGVGQLLSRTKPLALVGVAGAGKTTWMRWIFRRLIEELTAVPLSIELRKLAADWVGKDVRGDARTLEKYLEGWLAEQGLGGFADQLLRLLDSKTGPRPVLLIDGWDELGSLGSELREKLSTLLSRFPRVLAVVSSRPWGETRPSSSEQFETLQLQPLSDPEILGFGQKFHHLIHARDETAAAQADEQFKHSLSGAPDALALARTPLLLTMMLMISRDRPLPDKRHRLYQVCMECLLTARPQAREREGVQIGPEQWTPPDSAERMRIVSHLAFSMQSSGYKDGRRGPIVRKWEDVAELLPKEWEKPKKDSFLAWLVGAAGVLSDRADGTLSFAHLSFQEFLCAYHFLKNTEGVAARLGLCSQYLTSQAWWETLRLWAAQLHDDNPENLDPVLKQLTESEEPAGFWLVGAMLADGVGQAAWAVWRSKLPGHFHVRDDRYWTENSQTWTVSRQLERKQQLADDWHMWNSRLHPLSGLWATKWCFWDKPTLAPATAALFAGSLGFKAQVSQSRVMFWLSPTWPTEPREMMLLRLLSSPRASLGLTLQTASTLGASREEIKDLVRYIEKRDVPIKSRLLNTQLIARDLAQFMVRDLAQNPANYLTMDFARSFAQDFAQNYSSEWARELENRYEGAYAQDYAEDLAQGCDLDYPKDYALASRRHDLWIMSKCASSLVVSMFGSQVEDDPTVYFIKDSARNFAQEYAMETIIDSSRTSSAEDAVRYLGEVREQDQAQYIAHIFANELKWPNLPPWFVDFLKVKMHGQFHTCALRSILVNGTLGRDLCSPFDLLQQACRASLRKVKVKRQLDKSLKQFSGIPLWPALARHIARISTEVDKKVLTDAISNPEDYPAPLSHGLACYWRGDLILTDGSELTLDELTDELGLPRLPLLEDYPADIDLPKDMFDPRRTPR